MSIISDAKRAYSEMIRKRKDEYEKQKSAIIENDSTLCEIKKKINDTWIRQIKGELSYSEAEKICDEMEKEFNIALKNKNIDEELVFYKPLCDKCNDTGYSHNKMCSCLNQYIMHRCFEAFDLTDVLQRDSFDSFDENIYTDATDKTKALSAVKKCKTYVEEFDIKKPCLLLMGKTGTGKTFFSHCIAKEIISKGYTVLCVTAYRIIDEMTKEAIGESDKSFSNFIQKCDLLIIDDLGTERQTDFAENIFFNIFNERTNLNLPIVVTTNLTANELKLKYGERLVSRMFGNCDGIKMPKEDIRMKIKIDALKKQ